MLHPEELVGAVHTTLVVAGEVEALPTLEAHTVALTLHDGAERLLGLELQPCVPFPLVLDRVLPGVAVRLTNLLSSNRGLEIGRGLEIVVVAEGDLPGVHRELTPQRGHHIGTG